MGAVSGCGRPLAPPAADLAAVRAALPAERARLALIGLDGADWDVILPLIEQGRLPVLGSLVSRGASGVLRSIRPTISPALWTTVVTGVHPERHGVRDFVYRRPGSYEQPLADSTIRERLALWNILSGLGLSVGVLDWYATWPAEPVNGFVVSDRMGDGGEGLAAASHPAPEHLAALLDPASLPEAGELPALERITGRFTQLPAGLAHALEDDIRRSRQARALYRQYRPDLFVFYYKGIDAVSHFYWKHHQPDPQVYGSIDPADTALLGPIIPLYYELCDQLLGAFLAELDPRTNVVVVSDHGFRACGRPDSYLFDIERLCSMLGLLEFEDPSMVTRRAGRRYRMSATRVFPHEGTKIVMPLGEREIPLYLNLAGREPEGLVDRARLPDELRRIRERLLALRTDLDTRVFADVRVPDLAGGPAGRQQPPDLYVRVNREIVFDHDLLIDGRRYPIHETFLWEYAEVSGTHRDDGILIAAGPGVRAGVELQPAGLLDVAPTLLALLGVPVPEDFEGRAIRAMLVHPEPAGPRVASYETLIPRTAPPPPGAAPIDEAARAKLRALGYVQ
jgi:predicted AlkP superfamily phosphohydrolase/phosphomutase